jgi:hypothetical protein
MSYGSGFKKQEYIHLHGLLREVAKYSVQKDIEAYEDIDDVEQFQEYLEKDVVPTSIHKSKSDHKDDIFLLAESITDFLDGEGQSVQL